MNSVLRIVSLFLLAACVPSVLSQDIVESRQNSCVNGMFTKEKELTEASQTSQLLWSDVYGGKKGFHMSENVVTIVNTTTTFPHYSNLLKIIQSNVNYPIHWSSSYSNDFNVQIPAGQGGAIYFTPTLMCLMGELSCSGKKMKGSLCSAFVPGSVPSGNFAFVSQENSTNHAMSKGHRVAMKPSHLPGGHSSSKNTAGKNSASLNTFSVAKTLLMSSIFGFILGL